MIPDFVRPFLWSYNVDALDLNKHKKTIIFHVLNYGSKEATDWLFSVYSRKEIIEAANSIPQTQWDKKSLHMWSLFLGIDPIKHRQIPTSAHL